MHIHLIIIIIIAIQFVAVEASSLHGDQSLGTLSSLPNVVGRALQLQEKIRREGNEAATAVELRHLATSLKWQGKLTGAYEALELMQLQYPDEFNIDDHLLLIRLLRGIGMVEEALHQTNLSLSTSDPKKWYPHFTTGMIFMDVGRLVEAERAFRMVNRLGTVDGNPAALHVATLLCLGKQNEAIRHYQKSLGQHAMVSRGHIWPEAGVTPCCRKQFEEDRLPRWYMSAEDERSMAARELREELEALQFAAKQKNPRRRFLMYSFGNEQHGVGLGSTVHQFAMGLSYALKEEMTLILPDVDEWWYSPIECPFKNARRGWECFFEPISTSSWKDVEHQDQVVSFQQHLSSLPPSEFLKLRDWIPTKYVKYGAFWYRSQLVDFLWRLRPWVRDHVRNYLSSLQWTTPIVAMHIRRGDWKAGRALIKTQDYTDAALDMVQKYGISRIFVASDDPQAVEEVVQWANEEKTASLTIVADRNSHRNPVENSGVLTLIAKFDRTRYALDAISTVEALAQADVLICTFGAHFGRLAHELRFARTRHDGYQGYLHPPLSLDTLWYLHP